MPRSRSRTRRSGGKRRTRVGGQEDDGTAALHEFLVPYTRVTLDEACAKKYKEPKLFVWHSAGNRWAQMEQEKVDDLWDPKKHDVKRLCKELDDNMFQLYPHMENTFKRALKDSTTRDVAGMYTDGENFVVVVRTPDEMFSAHQSFLAVSSLLGGGLGGYVAGSALPAAFDYGHKKITHSKEKDDANLKQLRKEFTSLSTFLEAPYTDEKVAQLFNGLQKIDTWCDRDTFNAAFDKTYSVSALESIAKYPGQKSYPWIN